MVGSRCWLAAVALGGALAAQVNDQNKPDHGKNAKVELQRNQRELQQVRSEADTLLDLRLRHDLGLPMPEADDLFRFDGTVTTEGREKAQKQLQSEDLTAANLLQRYNRLKTQVDDLKAAAAAAQQKQTKDEPEWVMVPRTGEAPKKPPTRTDPARPDATGTEIAATPPPDAAEPRSSDAVVTANLEPIRGQVQGSGDAGRIARALYKAGQTLVDQAEVQRRQQQSAVADELDARAKERLRRAIDALQPLTTVAEPALIDLFYRGKCLEALFRLDERHENLDLRSNPKEFQRREEEVRQPFISIRARDVTVKNKIEVLGPWALAAQTAAEHFRWINLHAGFKPKTPLESITWAPAEK
jgi:hypothetical protein